MVLRLGDTQEKVPVGSGHVIAPEFGSIASNFWDVSRRISDVRWQRRRKSKMQRAALDHFEPFFPKAGIVHVTVALSKGVIRDLQKHVNNKQFGHILCLLPVSECRHLALSFVTR